MKASTIFKALAIFGVGATTYLTIKAVPKVEDAYERYVVGKNFAKNDEEKELEKRYFIKEAVIASAPATISAIATIFSIVMLDGVHKRTEKALAASLYLAKTQIEAIRKEGQGEYEFEEDSFPKTKGDEIIVYDPYTDQMFPTTEKLIDKALDKANKRLNQYYFVTLNFFLKNIGAKKTAFGDTIGWSASNDSQMEHWEHDGPYIVSKLAPYDYEDKKVYVLDYDINPLWV